MVIYDRARSAISEMEPDAVDWNAVLTGAAWFHTTGITPALGEKAAEATRRALEAAKALGVPVSVDLNYRKKLWTEKQAQAVMGPLMRDVDVVIANEEDLQSVLGVTVPDTDVTSGHLDVDAYRIAAQQVGRDFGPQTVAVTLRESISASDNGWSAVLWEGATGTLASEPALRRPADRSHRRRRQLCGWIDLRPGHRPHPRERPALRGRVQRAQAVDSRRLQSGQRGRSGQAGRRRRLRPRAAVAAYLTAGVRGAKRTRTPPLNSRGVPMVVGSVPTTYSRSPRFCTPANTSRFRLTRRDALKDITA